jgi:o-succinylbenzoate synthase
MDKEFSDLFSDFQVLSIPLRNTFRGINVREVAIFQGRAGWSEFSPFLEYDSSESAPWLHAAVSEAHHPWPRLHRDQVRINATMPQVPPDKVAGILTRFPGAKTVKVKVDSFAESQERIEAVCDVIPDVQIRLDINGGWGLQQARDELFKFHHRFGEIFEYIEQPCNSLSDLKTLKGEIPYKIAADESIRKVLKVDPTALRESVDVAIIKWSPLGGISSARRLISELDMPVTISSALDTGIGISHGAALAASLEEPPLDCGLGTVALLESDILFTPLIPIAGSIHVERQYPDPALLEKYRASNDRQKWWSDRVDRIWRESVRDSFFSEGER